MACYNGHADRGLEITSAPTTKPEIKPFFYPDSGLFGSYLYVDRTARKNVFSFVQSFLHANGVGIENQQLY